MQSGERRRDTDDAYVKVQRVRVVTCMVHNLCSLEDDTALQPARATATERDLRKENPVSILFLVEYQLRATHAGHRWHRMGTVGSGQRPVAGDDRRSTNMVSILAQRQLVRM